MDESGVIVALAHVGKFLLRRAKLLIVRAHNLRDQEVEGSNPFAPTTSKVLDTPAEIHPDGLPGDDLPAAIHAP
jgi:hypothetical protein